LVRHYHPQGWWLPFALRRCGVRHTLPHPFPAVCLNHNTSIFKNVALACTASVEGGAGGRDGLPPFRGLLLKPHATHAEVPHRPLPNTHMAMAASPVHLQLLHCVSIPAASHGGPLDPHIGPSVCVHCLFLFFVLRCRRCPLACGPPQPQQPSRGPTHEGPPARRHGHLRPRAPRTHRTPALRSQPCSPWQPGRCP
jgi:hypothetical protein